MMNAQARTDRYLEGGQFHMNSFRQANQDNIDFAILGQYFKRSRYRDMGAVIASHNVDSNSDIHAHNWILKTKRRLKGAGALFQYGITRPLPAALCGRGNNH